MPTPALYARVSTREQVEGYSLDAQVRAAEAFCAARGWPPPAVYTDAGRSGFTDVTADRPAFAAMLDAAAAGEHDVIIVHKLDRFARSLTTTLRELQRLERAGVAFASIAEQMDFTTPIGRVLLAMLAAFAEFYSRNLGAEVRKGLIEKKRQGKWVGRVPFGALVAPDGTLTVDPAKADILASIYDALPALPCQAIADELNAAGVPPPGTGRVWYQSQLRMMRGRHGRWLAAQPPPWPARYARCRDTAHSPAIRASSRVLMLTGLLRCACGGGLGYHGVWIGRHGVERRRGQCRNNAAPGRGLRCRRWGGDMAAVEAAVTAWLFALALPLAAGEVPVETGARREFEARRRRVVDLHRDGLLTDAEYAAEKAALFAAESRLPAGARRREEVGRGLALARADWPRWDDRQRNAFLRGLVERFVVEDGAIAAVVWRPLYAGLWATVDRG